MSEEHEDFTLNDPYQILEEETIYKEDRWIGKLFAIYHKNRETTHLRLMSKSSHGGWQKRHGFNIFSQGDAEELVNAIGRLSSNIDWDMLPTDVIQLRQDLEEEEELNRKLRKRLEEQDQRIQRIREKQEEELRTRADELQDDFEELEEKIKRANDGEDIEEEEIQSFLKENPWLFGVEYADSEPKKLATSESEFDFYLTRFDNKNVIIELKRISKDILTQDGDLRAHVSKAVDQCMGYMEDTEAIAHSSQISETEEIEELRPQGIIIVGYDASEEAKEKLKSWNHTMNNVKIRTYSDLISKAETTLENIQEDDGDE